MIFTNDIYRFIGDAVLADGYRDIRDVPVLVIEAKIKEFLMMKLCESNEDLDITTLLTRLESFMDAHNKDKMMANFTFYLLWYMSMLQSYSIIWKIEDVNEPSFKESSYAPGKIEALITSKNINYIRTFNYVLEEAKKFNREDSRSI